MTENLTVVILAAGLGTRMRSRKAKVLHEAGGLALIEHVVRSALALTVPERVITVVGHQAERVQSKLATLGISFVEQNEQLGTGHALRVCENAASDREGLLIVLYGDCPLLSVETLEELLTQHKQKGSAATVITAKLDDPTGYGRAVTDAGGRVLAIVEHKVATEEQRMINEINSGIYCFDAALLWRYIPQIQPNQVSKEYYLTDIVEILNRGGHPVHALLHRDANELLGINTRVELALVDRIFRDRKTRELMLAGVTIEYPETVTIDSGVKVGMDSVIEAFTRLEGTTEIGENCRIGAGSIIRNSRLADAVEIAPYTLINSSVLESGVSAGPFARLRQDNRLEANVHIGNFVELKKAHLGEGTKAGHLAYLGDAEIGSKVNIGAGTVTCNYDGSKKHKTIIGDGAFIGTNGTLVAPLEVGAGAYVAAGSVITEPVPSDALGLGRSRQTNKENWAKQRRDHQKS